MDYTVLYIAEGRTILNIFWFLLLILFHSVLPEIYLRERISVISEKELSLTQNTVCVEYFRIIIIKLSKKEIKLKICSTK
jgi:hypothetical protein